MAAMSFKKKLGFYAAMVILVLGATGVMAEFAIRLANPQVAMYPRFDYSSRYGMIPFASRQIVQEKPGQWHFVYTTNEYGHRGLDVPLSNRYELPHVVVLGDSFTFGIGVNDGEEYSAVMRQRLKNRFEVVNLGVGSWGLTQEIRRFYELGQLYQPKIVVLQFCANDPSDNLYSPVTSVRDGRFSFHNSGGRLEWLRKILADSWIQRSQLYNLLHYVVYHGLRGQQIEAEMRLNPRDQAAGAAGKEEIVYAELLEAFADDLKAKNIRLIMFAVDGQFASFPHILKKVRGLHQSGKLTHVELMDWFGGQIPEKSPEGHWAASSHGVVGERLSEIVGRSD